MATFNSAHHETGGVILFSGELILLFCDNVNLSLPQTNQSDTGRLYLTTHRMIFTSKSMKNSLKSFSAPFYTMHDLNLEQPIFGANYIKGKVNDAQSNNEVVFKLKFSSGGAIEYGQALQNAARIANNISSHGGFQPPPPYTPSASQYYQAPPTVYQPAYNVGFVLPTDIFNQPPPAGFIYTSEAPPPYPGLGTQQPASAPGAYPSAPGAYPSVPGVYPSVPSYPGAAPQPGFNVNVGNPTPAYPAYPGQQASPYPPPPSYSSIPNSAPVYPNINNMQPSAPSSSDQIPEKK